jgi:hypothetical protein
MKQELDKYLCDTFPKIFKRITDPDTPPMYPISLFGLECDDGWFDIINQLCQNIQHHIDWSINYHDKDVKYNEMIQAAQNGDMAPLQEYWRNYKNADEFVKKALESGIREVTPVVPQVVVDQVKEKFGTLRFYYQGGDDYISGLVSMAESMSGVTCEVCGKPGKSTRGGWIQTLCVEHGGPAEDDNDDSSEF